MILERIVEASRARVAHTKSQVAAEDIRKWALPITHDMSYGFEDALRPRGLSYICEVKRASPSAGDIVREYPYLKIAREYAAAGASAISVLTEPDFFKGDSAHLREISAAVQLPTLRKDFVIDAYQIYEARLLGASAVLLICAILDLPTLRAFIKEAQLIGLSALVEVHDEADLDMALNADAGIIGINNRDLRTFKTDIRVTGRLKEKLPPGVLCVAESGVHTRADVAYLEGLGVDGVLIGEALMRETDKQAKLDELRGITRG